MERKRNIVRGPQGEEKTISRTSDREKPVGEMGCVRECLSA